MFTEETLGQLLEDREITLTQLREEARALGVEEVDQLSLHELLHAYADTLKQRQELIEQILPQEDPSNR